MKKAILIVLMIIFSAGCTIRHGNFTLLSTKNVEISRVDLKRIQLVRNQTGTDTRLWFLFIPLGSEPTVEEAVDECIENGSGDFLTSAVIYRKWGTCLLFTWGGWKVTGDVGNSISAAAGDLPDRNLP